MRKFWIWYDGLDGLWKLLLCFLFFVVGFGAISFGTEMHHPFLTFGGILFLFVLLFGRIRFLREKAKSEGLKTHGRRI